MSNQHIPKERLTAYERWEVAAFDEEDRLARTMRTAGAAAQASSPVPEETADPAPPTLTQAELDGYREAAAAAGHEIGHREGFAAGFAEGHAEGLARGDSAAGDLAQRLTALAASFETAVQASESALAEDILRLSIDLARQVLRTQIEHRPELVLPVVREAMAALLSPHGHPLLILSPEDAALVRPYLADQIAHTGWRIVEDPTLARGGCRVESGGTEIDATLPERWRRAVAMLGQSTAWLDRA